MTEYIFMKNTKHLVAALAVLLSGTLSCTFLKDKFGTNDAFKAPHFAHFDPDGPMVSPGAYVIRIMAKDEPELAPLIEEIGAAERKMMKQIVDDYRIKPQPDNAKKETAKLQSRHAAVFEFPAGGALLMFQSGGVELPTYGDGALFGGFTGYLKGMLADALTNKVFNQKLNKTEKVEGGTSTMNVEIGASPDGSTVMEIGIVTETEKNGAKARTEMKARVDGQDCPNAEGQVPITIKIRLAGQSGDSSYEQDVTAFVRLVIDDNAEIAKRTIDITQATGRKRNGTYVFVESGVTFSQAAGDSERTSSNGHITQSTDNAKGTDVTEFATSGNGVALGAADAAITAAEMGWKGGACIRIEARSPGMVDLGSHTEIPVKVRHKKDGSDVIAKLETTLDGETSIDPTLMPKTPGTLMYVAPGASGKSATISLTATSRRGIAKLELNANTGSNAYRIAGGLDDWYTNTVVCNIMEPFTLTGGGFTMKFSGGLSGTYSYTGPFNAKGTGTYEISFPNGRDKGGDMVGRGDGTITGDGKVYQGSGTESYSLYTVNAPCVDGPVEE